MTTALILAAGEGSRFGGPKALARAADRSFLAHVMSTCQLALLDEIVVVTGSAAADVKAEAEAVRGGLGEDALPLRCVENPQPEAGRTGSLQAGWREAGEVSVLLFPVDHPAVRIQSLDALLGAHCYTAGHAEVLIPVTQDGPAPEGAEPTRRRGHPVILSWRLREAVLELPPDAPLNEFLRDKVRLEVPVDDPGILLNVNEPTQLDDVNALLRDAN